MTTIIPQSQQGGIKSGYATVVASTLVPLPLSAATVTVQAIMNAADIAAYGNVVSLAIAWTMDGANPGHAASCTWQSGYLALPGGGFGASAPGLKIPIPAGVRGFAGQLVLPVSLDIGLAIDIQDADGHSLALTVPDGPGMPIEVPVYPVLK